MRISLRLSFFVAFLAITLMTCVCSAQTGLQKARDAQAAHNPNFFEIDGVVATGISAENGKAIIKVYTEDEPRGIPAFVRGVKVRAVKSGAIFAGDNPVEQFMGGPGGGNGNGNGNGGGPGGGGGVDPQDRQARPVPIGVSIGTYRPNASNLCFAGTLGCRLKRIDMVNNTTDLFILSNNHVMAEQNAGTTGVDQVIQPGTLDNNCTLDLNDIIGELTDFEPIRFNGQSNAVDAAIATTTDSETGFASPSSAYGAPSATTVTADIDDLVQKFGRTTGFTEGRVDAINVTVNVQYDAGVATFTDQVVIVGTGKGKKRTFSSAGDSGSLIVTQDGNKPLGLLFAGSSTITIANQIDVVLDTFS